MQPHVGTENTIISMQPKQRMVVKVHDPKAGKNAQGGPRNKDNKNNNMANNKRVLPKSIQSSVTAPKGISDVRESPLRILKREPPYEGGPILTPIQPEDAQHASGPIMNHEEKERKAKEERLILERMRTLTKANPSLVFEDMF